MSYSTIYYYCILGSFPLEGSSCGPYTLVNTDIHHSRVGAKGLAFSCGDIRPIGNGR